MFYVLYNNTNLLASFESKTLKHRPQKWWWSFFSSYLLLQSSVNASNVFSNSGVVFYAKYECQQDHSKQNYDGAPDLQYRDFFFNFRAIEKRKKASSSTQEDKFFDRGGFFDLQNFHFRFSRGRCYQLRVIIIAKSIEKKAALKNSL